MSFDGSILALDLATQTGWACGRPGEVPRCGSLAFARAGHSMAARFAGCARWLNDFVAVETPRVVVFEAPLAPSYVAGHTSTDTVRLLMGLTAIIEATLYDSGIDVREASVSTVRQFFLGTTRIKSADAKIATKKRCVELGWRVVDDNAADACALWAYQVSVFVPAEGVKLLPLFGRIAE